jgi:RNA polymerase sigma factor (sigma-70 family)
MSEASPRVVEALVRSHRRFLDFARRRTASDAQAEEVLQAAFARALAHAGEIADEDRAVAWFYRVLRNALADVGRLDAAERRALAAHAAEQPVLEGSELVETVCACLGDVVPTLAPQYADILAKVDLGSTALPAYADAHGITTGNARVRLHRARQALRKALEGVCRACAEHGCLDCTCRHSV